MPAPKLPSFSATFLGQYADLTPLGSGGMGAVFRGRDVRLDRPVAIKVLKEADEEARARFVREERLLASLEHPNVVRAYDCGCDGEIPFIVMELVDGESREERHQREPLAVADALRIAVQIAEAIARRANDEAARAALKLNDDGPRETGELGGWRLRLQAQVRMLRGDLAALAELEPGVSAKP